MIVKNSLKLRPGSKRAEAAEIMKALSHKKASYVRRVIAYSLDLSANNAYSYYEYIARNGLAPSDPNRFSGRKSAPMVEVVAKIPVDKVTQFQSFVAKLNK